MPDVGVNIGGDDDLTPKINQIKDALKQLGEVAIQVGQMMSQALGGEEFKTYTNYIDTAVEAMGRLRDAQGRFAAGDLGSKVQQLAQMRYDPQMQTEEYKFRNLKTAVDTYIQSLGLLKQSEMDLGTLTDELGVKTEQAFQKMDQAAVAMGRDLEAEAYQRQFKAGEKIAESYYRDPEAYSGVKFTQDQLTSVNAYADATSAIGEHRKDASEFDAQSAENLQNIAELTEELVAFEERYAQAVKAGTEALEEAAAAARERGRAEEESSTGGMGGFVKHGMFAQAVSGFKEGGISSAMSGLAKGMGSTLMMVMEWTWAWRLAEIPLNAVAGSLQEMITVFTQLNQEQHASGESIQEYIGDLDNLGAAAIRSGSSISAIMAKRQELMGVGFTKPEATREAEHIQTVMTDTGANISNLVEKAKYFKASAEDVLAVSEKAGGAYSKLTQPAAELATAQALRPAQEALITQRENTENRLFEDQTHNAQHLHEIQKVALRDEMEDRHLADSRHLEDVRRITEEEMQDRFRLINREREASHLAINREMEDRHRAADYAEADFNRIHGRQIGAITGMAGAAESALFGQPMEGNLPYGTHGKSVKTYFSLPEGAREKILGELKQGFEQFQKDTGIDRGTAEQMIRSGVLSTGVIQQEAQAAREEQQALAKRARDQEGIKENKRQQDEDIKDRISQENELTAVSRQLATEQRELNRTQQDESITASRNIAQADREFAEAVYQHRIFLERKYQDERLQLEKNTLLASIKLNFQAQGADIASIGAGRPLNWTSFAAAMGGAGAQQYLKGNQPPQLNDAQQAQADLYKQLNDSMQDTVDETEKHNDQINKTGVTHSNFQDIINGIGTKYTDQMALQRQATEAHTQVVQDATDAETKRVMQQTYGGVWGQGKSGLSAPEVMNVEDKLVASKIEILTTKISQLLTIS